MIEAAIGIDIGTSYIKAAARARDGTILATCRVDSVSELNENSDGLQRAILWWHKLKEVVQNLLNNKMSANLRVVSFCITAIAPTMIVFDLDNRKKAYGILYSWIPDNYSSVDAAQFDLWLTDRRLELLRDVASSERFSSPCITDLVGYLNWWLTGELTINSISLVEFGLGFGIDDYKHLSVQKGRYPLPVAPKWKIGEVNSDSACEFGIEIGIPVCGGCPDTIGSIIATGLIPTKGNMLYLGTFGSLLQLDRDVEELLSNQRCLSSPFRWLLSIPGLGPKIEQKSRSWFAPRSRSSNLRAFDSSAETSQPGADGTLFLVPRWKSKMLRVGRFEFLPDKLGDYGDLSRKSRAILESIGYAIRAVKTSIPSLLPTSGGGASSNTWLQIISEILQSSIIIRELSWEASGAADIAARLAWKEHSNDRPIYKIHPLHRSNNKVIEDNYQRVVEIYRRSGWL